MPDKKEPRKQTRIKIEDIRKTEKELTKDEQKKVSGGGARNPDGTVNSVGSDFIER